MPNEIGAYEAKKKLQEILHRVEAGETVTITNRGKPVADVVPSRAGDQINAETAIANILKARKQKISDQNLYALKSEGRK